MLSAMPEDPTKVYRKVPGLRGLWLHDTHLKIPRRHLGARIHILWIYDPEEIVLKKHLFPAYPCYYAGYILLPGARSITGRFVKESTKQDHWRSGRVLHVSCDGINKLQELDEPNCGDTGVFELWIRGPARALARYFHRQIKQGGYLIGNIDFGAKGFSG